MGTTEAQQKATQLYQQGKARVILWLPKAEKEWIDSALQARDILPRDVFRAGLKACGIEIPESIRDAGKKAARKKRSKA